jgi:hypothetical protein
MEDQLKITLAKKKINEIINHQFFPIEEYQDKYYFLKRIKSIFPELSNEKIAGALEFANKKAKSPGKKKKYVNALSYKMFLT